MCLKGKNVQKAKFYWSAKITYCKYQQQSLISKIKKTNDKTEVVIGASL